MANNRYLWCLAIAGAGIVLVEQTLPGHRPNPWLEHHLFDRGEVIFVGLCDLLPFVIKEVKGFMAESSSSFRSSLVILSPDATMSLKSWRIPPNFMSVAPSSSCARWHLVRIDRVWRRMVSRCEFSTQSVLTLLTAPLASKCDVSRRPKAWAIAGSEKGTSWSGSSRLALLPFPFSAV